MEQLVRVSLSSLGLGLGLGLVLSPQSLPPNELSLWQDTILPSWSDKREEERRQDEQSRLTFAGSKSIDQDGGAHNSTVNLCLYVSACFCANE